MPRRPLDARSSLNRTRRGVWYHTIECNHFERREDKLAHRVNDNSHLPNKAIRQEYIVKRNILMWNEFRALIAHKNCFVKTRSNTLI